MLAEYRAKERESKALAAAQAADDFEHGKSAFDTPVAEALASFLAHLEARAQARRDAPAGSRIGIAPGTEYLARQALREWRDWLVEQGHTSLTTGELDQSLFRSFVLHLGSTDGPRGPRSNASISRICRNLKVLVRVSVR